MSNYESDFFEGKRPWSRVKDTILRNYMRPYLTKVRRLGNRIIIIDGFAGPGEYGEDHVPGSPRILEGLAREIVPHSHSTYFINKNKKHHKSLSSIREKEQWTQATALQGTAEQLIPEIVKNIKGETLFLYLDPFGPSVCPFSIIEPLLRRKNSTELLVVFHAPALYRLAARHRVESGNIDDQIRHNHRILSDTLGGDYWQDILWDTTLSREERELQVVAAYCERIGKGTLQYTGFCPVQRRRNSAAKYYVVFATSHIDGITLMNDEMVKAFESFVTEKEFEDTLFADQPWQTWRDLGELPQIALELIINDPGRPRRVFWQAIIRQFFFRFTESEFNKVIKTLCYEKRVRFESPTKKLGDEARLYPVNSQLRLF